MADVFISHASADRDATGELAESLRTAGFTVWWDADLVSGQRYHDAVTNQLNTARAVVVVWTPSSVVSDWVYSEARRSNDQGKLVQVRTTEVSVDDLPAPFDAYHCAQLVDTAGIVRAVSGLVHSTPVIDDQRPASEAPSAAESASEADTGPAPAVRGRGRERKIVTVLVADFPSAAPLDPEDVEAQLSPYRAACKRVIEGFGGTVERLAGDAMMAVFGAPTAHEDDPERAVRAALGMCEAVVQLDSEGKSGLSVRTGVATGEALVSRSEQSGFGKPTVTGQVMSTAIQLQSAAPVGGVLVDQDTYLSSRTSIEFEPHDPAWLALAGSRGSVGDDLADTSRPMIGREDELAQLQRAFSRAVRESSVQLVTIVAEPGLGKSRLVQAFFDWIDAREELVTWRQGKCPPYGDSVAYAALAEVLKAQCGILDSDPADLVESKLEGTVKALVEGTELGDQASWLVARLAPLVGLAATEAPREELFTAWRRFLEALALTGPLVVVVEDLHWADPALLDFLTHLLEWAVGVPLVIVATARPEFYDKAPAWAAGMRNATTLSLAPLDNTESDQLVASLLGTRVLPAELQAALLAKAAGNPLYAREFLTILTDQNGSDDLDETRIKELVETLPGSVQAVIAARLDTLPPEAKHLMQAAAVVGHTFWSGAVAALTGVDEVTVRERLHDLVRRDYLRPSRGSRIAGQAEYTFGHALIADVAYGQLPRKERARHHQSVANWHATRITDPDTSSDSALVAHHYHQSHQMSRNSGDDPAAQESLAASAATWHTHAAEHARHSDITTALALARTAVDQTSHGDPLRPSRLILLGRLEGTSGQHGRAAVTFDEARSAAEHCGNQLLAADAQVRLSTAIRSFGRTDEAETLLAAAIAVLEQQPPGRELVNAYLLRCSARRTQGRLREARESVEQAMALIDQLNDAPEVLVLARMMRGEVRIWSGDSEGVEDLKFALELAERHNLTTDTISCNDLLATWTFFARTAHEALDYSQTTVRTCQMTGKNSELLGASRNLADNLVVLGRLDEAFAVYEAATSAVVDSPSRMAELWTEWAFAHLVRGNTDAARSLIARAWPISRDGNLEEKGTFLLIANESQQLSQHASEDHNYAEELIRLLENPDPHELFAQELSRLARVLVVLERVDLLERAIENTPGGLVFYDNNNLSARAVLAQARHEYAEGSALHEQSAVAWAAYGYPLEQAHALIGAARCATALDQPARHLLNQARAILTDIGARPLLAETDRRLDDATA